MNEYKTSSLRILTLSSLQNYNYSFCETISSLRYLYNYEDLLRATLINLCTYKRTSKSPILIFSEREFYMILGVILSRVNTVNVTNVVTQPNYILYILTILRGYFVRTVYSLINRLI